MAVSISILLMCCVAAAAVGGFLVWLSHRGGVVAQRASLAELALENKRLQEEAGSAKESAAAGRAAAELQRERAERLEADRAKLLDEKAAAEDRATAAETELKGEKTQSAEKLALLSAAREDLSNQFKVLAAEILKEQSGVFTAQNETNLGRLLDPLRIGLQAMAAETQKLETKREGAYTEVLTEIKNVKETHERLRSETTQLVAALRAPKVRGNWGELQLRRCIEFSGMVEHASFDLEVAVSGEEGSIRPDCVIHLPNHRTLVIDAKTPFDSFLDAMQTTDETVRALKLVAHADRVRRHLNELSSKAYWKQFRNSGEGNSPDFVICFLSSEVLFSAALEQDPGLIEHGANSNVILATPTTLIALLKAVAYGWQQMEITRNAIAIRDAGQALYSKLAAAHDHLLSMGKAISSSAKHYNSLVGSMEGKGGVFSLAGRMREMGVGQESIPESLPIESAVRDLRANDWLAAPSADDR